MAMRETLKGFTRNEDGLSRRILLERAEAGDTAWYIVIDWYNHPHSVALTFTTLGNATRVFQALCDETIAGWSARQILGDTDWHEQFMVPRPVAA